MIQRVAYLHKRMVEFNELPEGCIAAILSHTTPVDACRFSLISKTFCFAADSDAVWNQFLPSDPNFINSIISHSPSLANIPAKKDLYLALSDRPIIIDNGKKSFQLDRKSGKKCYMLASRSLDIASADNKKYWTCITMPDSRFPEIIQLFNVCWFGIRGMINTIALSPNTQYAVYVVFKMIHVWGFWSCLVELSVGVEGGHSNTKIVCLDPDNRVVGLQRPSLRSDGWFEIEMGEFFNSGLEDEEVQMSVNEVKRGDWHALLLFEGIEVRPKYDN